MKNNSAKILEFDKVLGYLSEYALSELGVQRCLNTPVYDDVNTIKAELLLTSQARTIFNNAMNVPLDNVYDIEKSLGKSVISSSNALNYQYIDENKQIENK